MAHPSHTRIHHFHIRWHPAERIDWEAFESREKAEQQAESLTQGDEAYTIEEFDASCPQCERTLRRLSESAKREARHSNPEME